MTVAAPTLLSSTSVQNDLPGWAVPLIILGFFVVFPIFWCGASWLSSRLTGWSHLAKRYPAPELPEGKDCHGIGGAGWGPGSHRVPLRFRATGSGLHLTMPPLFACGFRPLLIPWGDLHDPKPAFSLGQTCMRLSAGTPRVGKIWMPRSFYTTEVLPRIAPPRLTSP